MKTQRFIPARPLSLKTQVLGGNLFSLLLLLTLLEIPLLAQVPSSVPGTNAPPASTNSTRAMIVTNTAGEKIIKAGVIKFQAAPLDQVLEVYADLVGRTLLRPASLPSVKITLKTQNDLTLKEAKEALDSMLSLNGITTVLVGEKFITIVPTAQAQQEAATPPKP